MRYWTANDSTTLKALKTTIHQNFPSSAESFIPKFALIVTWNDTGYFDLKTDLVSTRLPPPPPPNRQMDLWERQA